MTWSPDAALKQHLGRIITRAFEEAHHKMELKARGERSALATHLHSGAAIRIGERLAAEAFADAGKRAIRESLAAFAEVYGSIPPGASEWLRNHLKDRFDSFADARTKALADKRASSRIPSSGIDVQMRGVAASLKRDLEIELGPIEIRERLTAIARSDLPSAAAGARPVDAFISHASEDKPDVARPLAEALKQRGFSVWLDEKEIVVGQSIFESVDDGLRRCRFGVVILSPAFFNKQWPSNELHALAALGAAEGKNKILPVWHEVDREYVSRFSTLLLDLYAANTRDGIEKVADDIAAVLRPAGRAGPMPQT